MGHALELDDDHRTSVLHPAVAVIPAALSICEREKADGKTFITAVVIGYELMTRIGDAFLGTQYYEGFHPTGTCGVFGAAAAGAKVLKLDKEKIVKALGIAGTQAAGLEEWKADGSWIKRLHPGKAAHSGLLSALLAQRGYTGPSTIMEGENGFLKGFSFERKWDVSKILDDLGKEYRGYGTSFKPYACCRFSHQVIDATLALVNQHNIQGKDIEEVTVRICTTFHSTLFNPPERRYKPGTVVDAQFSIPYTVAVTILRRQALQTEFTNDTIKDPEILALTAKVKGIADLEYEKLYPDKYPTTVTIRTKSGNEYSQYTEIPKGDPENPIYKEDPKIFNSEIEEKFTKLVKSSLFKERVEPLIKTVNELDKISDINMLTRYLSQ
jgi:2-methylcitrate dehydratase PrpD